MRNPKGIITQIKTLETHDGPGIRTTIFIKGCPLRCAWCSNPETQQKHPELYFIARRCGNCGTCVGSCSLAAITLEKDYRIDREKCNLCMRCVEACPNGALEKVGVELTAAEIIKKVLADKPFFNRSGGGVTVSGGEPLSQPEFVSEIFRMAREEGIHTCLDTSGCGNPSDLTEMLDPLDLILLDIKHMDPEKHKRWTGVSNESILRNAESMAAKCQVRISIPLIPGVNDDFENIEKTILFAKSVGIQFIDILPFHRLGEAKYEFLGLPSPYRSFDFIAGERVQETIQWVESRDMKATKGRLM